MNEARLRRGFHYDDQSGSLGIWVDGTKIKDYVADEGRTFYVNNITGSSANDGQSWANAFDEVSTAVTAADAFQATQTASNRSVMNNILVQGTSTAYTGLTALANYSRLIGVGANPYGNGAGIPRLGADTYVSGEYGLITTTTIRGLYTSGIQWQCTSNEGDCFRVQHMFRSTIEDSAFFVAGAAQTLALNGIQFTGSIGGLVMRDCTTGTNAGRTSIMVNGMYIGGTTFNNCLIENCRFAGSSTGVYVISTCVNGHGSVFKNCYMGDLGNDECTKAIDENSTATKAAGGSITFMGCYVNGADPIEPSQHTERFVGCIAANAMAQT